MLPPNSRSWRSPALATLLVAATLSAASGCGPAQPPAAAVAGERVELSIPFHQYSLDSGLTVIVHEDHWQPRVVVALSYQVGSRDERAGRTGFAHLFEHLMFMGTDRVPLGEFDAWLEREGGRGNAWTSEDRTFFYDVGPAHTLELLLWMEADRLAVLGAQITPGKLDTQRKVVHNERHSEIENVPYGKEELRLPALLFPAGHPYAHPIIGASADLEAATVADVRAFFARHYRPDNAALIIGGDVDPARVKALVQRCFGAIGPDGSLAPRSSPAAAQLDKTVRATIEDSVTLPKLTMAWLSPPAFAPGDAELDLLAAIVAKGKTSRLYRTLVHEQRLAATIDARQHSRMLQSVFSIEALAQPGVSLAQLERALDRELGKLRRTTIGSHELERAKRHYETAFVARLQSLEQRTSMLASYWAHRGEPGFVADDLARYQRATVASLQRVTAQTLKPNGRVVLRTVPRGSAASARREADRD